MKIPFKDKVVDVATVVAKPLINYLLAREITVVPTEEVIKKEREQFILIANHVDLWDPFVVMNKIDTKIRFLEAEIGFLDPNKKTKLAFLRRSIPKQAKEDDFLEISTINNYLAEGYCIGLFPEINNSFTGETRLINKSAGNFIKNAGVDVILVKQQGGYLAQPRWADYFAIKGEVHTKTFLLLTKTEIKELSSEKINAIITEAIYNNDYDFQRQKMIEYHRKARAEGIERLVYYCSNCGGVLTVFGKGDDLICSQCGKIGHFNEYEFIEGNKFDNLVDYNQFQYTKIEEVIKSEFVFVVTLNLVNYTMLKNVKLGDYKVRYKNKKLHLSDNLSSYVFELEKMRFPVNTMQGSFSFDYEDDTYNFTNLRHQYVIFEMCRYLNESHLE